MDVKDLRYQKNRNCISEEDQLKLFEAKVCVLGCGGLGGHNIELLSRIGVGSITVVDGDIFDRTNLNRQLLANSSTLGRKKAEVAKERVNQINPDVNVNVIPLFFDRDNGRSMLEGQTLVIDALDSIESRRLASDICEELNIPYIYGAIAGWYGQVATILPGDRTLEKLYKYSGAIGKEKELGNPSFAPSLVASLQVSEAIKLITQKGELLRNRFLFINSLNHEYEVFDLT